jgi:hypothetical protein
MMGRNKCVVAANWLMVLAGLVILGGCNTNKASTPSGPTTPGMGAAQTSALLGEAGARVDDANARLGALLSGTSLPENFQYFTRSIDQLQSTAESVRESAVGMRARADEHAAAWEKELTRVSSPEARSVSDARRAAFTQRFDEVRAALLTTKDQYDDYLAQLKDIRIMLRNDLTREGVAETRPVIESAIASGRELRKSIRHDEDLIDQTRIAITSGAK